VPVLKSVNKSLLPVDSANQKHKMQHDENKFQHTFPLPIHINVSVAHPGRAFRVKVNEIKGERENE